MSIEKDKYRNPPFPIGVHKEDFPDLKYDEDIIENVPCKYLKYIIDSGILDEPDVTSFRKFVIQTSDEDDEFDDDIQIPTSNALEIKVEEVVFETNENKAAVERETNSPVSSETSKRSKALSSAYNKKCKGKKQTSNSTDHSDSSIDCKETKISNNRINKAKGESSKDRISYYTKNKDDSYGMQKPIKSKESSDNEDQDHTRRKTSMQKQIKKKDESSDDEDSDHSRKKSSMQKKIQRDESSDDEDQDHSRKKSSMQKKIQRAESCDDEDRDHSKKKSSMRKKIQRDESSDDEDRDHSKKKSSMRKKIQRDESSDGEDRDYSRKRSSFRKKFQRDESSDNEDRDHSRKKTGILRKLERNYSDDEDKGHHSRWNTNRSQHSPSPYYSDGYENVESDMFAGYYHCKVCNITMNSEATYETHILGKKHLKAQKLKNTVDTVSKSIKIGIANKCPLPPPGVIRIATNDRAMIQTLVEGFTTPCPGLENVIEIQGIQETSYYCKLCDAPCAASSIAGHLHGFKHQLKCLKFFKPVLHERMAYEPKYVIERRIREELNSVERAEGRGSMSVEKEFHEEDARLSLFERQSRSSSLSSRSSRDIPSISQFADFSHDFKQSLIPDASKPDFYCKVCDSHMNSSSSWNSHIIGKRHITNLKKGPGSVPSKSRNIPIPHARANLLDRLKSVNEPIVGLNNIQEIQNPELGSVSYTCYLCGGTQTNLTIIEHVLSKKHREKYLKSINHPDFLLLEEMQMAETAITNLIAEICEKAEAEHGCGAPEVYVTKNAVVKF